MNKKIVSILLIIVFMFSCYTGITYGANSSAKVKVSVKLQSIECVENNHVGNEWLFGCTVNKKELSEGDTIEIATTSSGKITIISKAEEDDSIPDVGKKNLTIPVSKLKSNKDTTYTSEVTVTENRGRYSGNTAVWKFTFVVKKK